MSTSARQGGHNKWRKKTDRHWLTQVLLEKCRYNGGGESGGGGST